MKRIHLVRLGAIAAAVAMSFAARAQEAKEPPLVTQWNAAAERAKDGGCHGEDWAAISRDPGFAALPSAMRAITYINLASCVGGERRHEWRVLATKEPAAPPYAWNLLFLEAVDREDTAEALADLEGDLRAAEVTGEAFTISNDDGVYVLHGNLSGDYSSRRLLLTLLDRANWRPNDPAHSVSDYWAELSAMLIEDGKPKEAERVAHKVTEPADLLGMRLDRRFAAFVSADPSAFDVARAAAAALARLQATYAAAEDDDNGAYEIADALMTLGRFDEAVAFTGEVLKKGRVVDDKGDDYRNWIEDRRAYALLAMGRVEEALTQERIAAARSERGHTNISQIINLAEMLIDEGRFREAREVLAPLGDQPGRASPLGAGFLAQQQVCILGELGDTAGQRDALALAAARAGHNRAARLKALLCANDLAGAADLMVAWLDNPVGRPDALVQLCRAPSRRLGAYAIVLGRRFDAVRRDPKVAAAVAQYGRTEPLGRIGAKFPASP